MSSGASSGVVVGTTYTQLSLEQLNSINKAIENEKRLSEIDFYVAPNGKVLPKEFKEWIGTNQREHLLNSTNNTKLKNAINQLYRPGAIIGNGGTASVIRFEKATGIGLGRNGNTHIKKGREMIRFLEKKVLKQKDLSSADKDLANHLIEELKQAIYGG